MRTGTPPRARLAALPRAQQLYAELPAAQQALAAGLALDEVHCYLVATYRTLTMREQAEALGASRAAVRDWHDMLRRIGRIDPRARAGKQAITPAEAEAYARLFHAGHSAGAIAAMRGVARHRVERALRGVAPGTPRKCTYSAQRVAEIFGIHAVIVQGWARRGWLPDVRHRVYRGVHHRWSRADIIAFVRDRRTWHVWAPPQITDPEVRRVAEYARAEARGGWYQQGEIALMLGLNFSTFSVWLLDAPLDGLRQQPWRPGAPRYYWLTARQAEALSAWGERIGRSDAAQRRRVNAELRTWLRDSFGPTNPAAIAAD